MENEQRIGSKRDFSSSLLLRGIGQADSEAASVAGMSSQLLRANEELRRVERQSRQAATRLLEELLVEELDSVDLGDIGEGSVGDQDRFLRLASLLLGDSADAHADSSQRESDFTAESMPSAVSDQAEDSTKVSQRSPPGRPCPRKLDWDVDALNELATTGVASGNKDCVGDGNWEDKDQPLVQIDPNARVMLYSPSTGVHQAARLEHLRDGPFSLADIVEAASHSLTLDQMRKPDSKGDLTKSNFEDSVLQLQAHLERSKGSDQRGCFWLDIASPMPEEMDSLARAFGIHPLTVEDILTDSGDRDKMESVSDYTFLIYRAIDTSGFAHHTDSGVVATGFSMIIKRNCILTFHSACSSDHVTNALARLQHMPQLASPVYAAYVLIDDITDSLVPMMRAIEIEIDAVDDLVLVLSQNEKSDVLRRVGAVRRRILGIWRLLLGKPDVLRLFSRLMVRVSMTEEMHRAESDGPNQLRSTEKASMAGMITLEDIEHYLSDVYDHLVALISSCSHCEMVLARAHSNYMAQISLGLGEATVETGLFSVRWMVVAAILLPIQFVTGLFGQNVKVPWKVNMDEHDNDNLRAWFGILGCCMAFVVIVSAWARYKKIF